jgi:TetR/AcrR family transcriptional regulator, lmrAB and yxaGH operons repressor
VTKRGKPVQGMGSRERAVRAMARLLRRRGYAGTRLQHVVAEARAPVGSLYFHFPGGKAALAAEAVASAGGELGGRLAQLLAGRSAPDALEAIAVAMGEDLKRSRWRNGCPIATTALERGADDDVIRRAADGVFRGWEGLFAARLERDGIARDEARGLGVLIVSSLEGAIILARSQRSAAPLGDTARSLANLLRRTAPGTRGWQ